MTAPLPPLADTKAYPLASALRDCLKTELGRSLMGPVCCAMVRFGGTAQTLEGCDCQCEVAPGVPGRGTAWVRVGQVGVMPQLGRGAGAAGGVNATNCNGPWVLTYELGVSRCYERPPDGAALPCAAEDALAQQLLGDMAAVQRAVRCCKQLDDRTYEWVSWLPARSGGCAGGWATLRVVQP